MCTAWPFFAYHFILFQFQLLLPTEHDEPAPFFSAAGHAIRRDRHVVFRTQYVALSHAAAEVIRNFIVGGAVVQIDAEAPAPDQTVVMDADGLHRVKQGIWLFLFAAPAHRILFAQRPEAVAPPTVEGAVIAGFPHTVKEIVVFNQMPAEAAVAEIDAGARQMMDGVPAHGYAACNA